MFRNVLQMQSEFLVSFWNIFPNAGYIFVLVVESFTAVICWVVFTDLYRCDGCHSDLGSSYTLIPHGTYCPGHTTV